MFVYAIKFLLPSQLAMAEAEAAALRQELATRRGENDVDLSKLKPAKPAKRIDGTGFRETISGTGSQVIVHIFRLILLFR